MTAPLEIDGADCAALIIVVGDLLIRLSRFFGLTRLFLQSGSSPLFVVFFMLNLIAGRWFGAVTGLYLMGFRFGLYQWRSDTAFFGAMLQGLLAFCISRVFSFSKDLMAITGPAIGLLCGFCHSLYGVNVDALARPRYTMKSAPALLWPY